MFRHPVAPSELTKEQLRKSLRSSVLDGASYSAMLGFTQNYVTPYALALQASVTQIGLLSSIPNVMMVLTQLFAPSLSEKVGSRKTFIVPLLFLQALTWLPILLIAYIFPAQQVWWLVLFISLGTTCEAMTTAPWSSLMADLVPGEVRGRYFSSRSRIGNMVTMVFSLIAGGILQALTKNAFIGFSIIFAGAFVSRCLSAYFLSQMYEPSITIAKNNQQSIFKLIPKLISTNVGKFILFIGLVNATANMAGPFFSVYMLRDLKFNYITYVIISSITTLVMLFFMPYWGKRIDR
ncbi:MAG: MFS transporter, partial [Dehalococcoidales bacterium]|nr:MFS transporter [Dehalococcoidales bacterium]